MVSGGKIGITGEIQSIISQNPLPTNQREQQQSNDGQILPQTPPIPPPGPKSFPYYASGSVRDLHEDLYEKMVDLMLKKAVFFNSDEERKKPPFKFRNPEVLSKKINFNLIKQSPLAASKNGQEELLRIMEKVIDYSPKPSHPFMVHKNSSGLDPYGIVGDWLSTTMSSPVLTYILSPVFTLMELEVQERFRNLIGYPKNQGDGTITPGQGIGNSYAIQIALQSKFPGLKNKGFKELNPSVKPVMFVSEQGDYSFEKYCIWEGVGEDNCIRVKTFDDGRMDLADLRAQIKMAESQNKTPFLIVATAGTPVLGAIDDIDKIAKIASNNNIWLHVDAHLAGACLFSSKQKYRLKGIEKSDSVLWSADKMLAAPFVMTILVTKQSKIVQKTFTLGDGGAVVFQQDPFYDHMKWDTGDSTMQTTKRPDILKLWFMWKAKGLQGLSDQVDGTYKNTEICVSELKSRRGRFQLLLPQFDSNLVCFYFIPSSIKLFHKKDIVRILKANKLTEQIKRILLERGIMQISTGVLPRRRDLPTFFVMNMNNTAVTQADIKYMLDQIEYQGNRVVIQNIKADSSSLSDGESEVDENEEVPENLDGEKEQEKTIDSVINTIIPIGVPVVEPSVPPPPSSYPDYVSAPIESMHKNMFQRYFKLVFQMGTYYQDQRDSPSFIFQKPEELLKKFDFTLDSESGSNLKRNNYKTVPELLEIIQQVILYTPKLGHPYYMFQLVSGLDPYTLMADYIATCMTSPMYTYEDSPAFNLMEDAVLGALRDRAGFKDGSGLILVGGSISNQLPIFLSYIRKFKASKAKGDVSSQKPGVIFISEAGHYATPKGSFYKGIGLDSCVFVNQNDRGRMDVADLETKVKRAIQQNKVPFMVCATVGTTVLGAYDQINPIADVCKKYDMWLHCDGAYGGSVLLSDKEKFRLDGLERADSFTFNPHKAFASARYTTNWICKDKNILRQVAPVPSKQYFRLNTGLYDQEKYDTGEFQILTDRRPDVFKMWMLWKAKGTVGLGKHIDQGFDLTDYAYLKLLGKSKEDKRYQPVIEYPPECSNINFLYVPKSFLGKDLQNEKVSKRLQCVQNTILALILFNNKWVSSVEGIGKIPQHQIFCLYNTCMTREDVDYFFDYIDYFGNNLDLETACKPDDNDSVNLKVLESTLKDEAEDKDKEKEKEKAQQNQKEGESENL